MKSTSKNTVITSTLPSGLKTVCRHEDTGVEYFGVTVNAGSRDDPEGMEGLAHFVEHVLFKGTTHRKSWHIINRMESRGGELNAFTSKETTVVYTVSPRGNLLRAIDLMSDLLCNSVFPTQELEREREVVADEINQYLDMPSEAVFDDFDDMIFAGSALGHNILGKEANLSKFTPEVCHDYMQRNFTADNMVAFYAGATQPSEVVRNIEKYFASLPATLDRNSRKAPLLLPKFEHETSYVHNQENTVMGCRIPDMYSPSKWPIALLSNILGGPGMNSKLNVELRERRGLVYAVDSSTSMLTDCGLFTIYFACDPADTTRCRNIVERTVSAISQGKISDRFIERAKRQYLGQLAVAADSRESSVLSMARGVLYYGSLMSRHEIERNILVISTQDIINTASHIIDPGFSVLTLK